VALDWTLDLLFAKDLVHFMILRSPAISHSEAQPSPPGEEKQVARAIGG